MLVFRALTRIYQLQLLPCDRLRVEQSPPQPPGWLLHQHSIASLGFTYELGVKSFGQHSVAHAVSSFLLFTQGSKPFLKPDQTLSVYMNPDFKPACLPTPLHPQDSSASVTMTPSSSSTADSLYSQSQSQVWLGFLCLLSQNKGTREDRPPSFLLYRICMCEQILIHLSSCLAFTVLHPNA